MQFKKTTLKNGIRVVTENQPHSRAVSVGVWICSGTRSEPAGKTGLSHFVEHLVFKGTKTKSALQIAKSLEVLGGDLNAYTTREYTCYHAMVLKEHWHKAVEVLSDLVSNMAIKPTDFELEKSVILQEIAMSDDSLEELIYDIYLDRTLPKHPLGRPILGTAETVSGMTLKDIRQFYKQHYGANRIIVSAAGALDHDEFVKGVQKYLGKKKKSQVKLAKKTLDNKRIQWVEDRPVEQLHFLMGVPCPSFKSTKRFESFVVNAFLGGGMTSRLYQQVREKRGLAYSIYSSLNTFEDFGMLNIYAACEPRQMKQVIESVLQEIARLKKQGIGRNELSQFKTQVKGNLLLGAEDIDSRMSSIAINEMVFGEYKSVENVIEELDRVSVESVNHFMHKYFDMKKASCVLMGGGAQGHTKWLKAKMEAAK